jgi:hypothetical protein
MGSRMAQYMTDRPSSKATHGKTWRERRVGAEEEFADLIEVVAWDVLAGRPCALFLL